MVHSSSISVNRKWRLYSVFETAIQVWVPSIIKSSPSIVMLSCGYGSVIGKCSTDRPFASVPYALLAMPKPQIRSHCQWDRNKIYARQ